MFHVTLRAKLAQILESGLRPMLGERSRECAEETPAIFLFPTRSDCDAGMEGWLGECFEDWPENSLAILEVEIPRQARLRSDVEYEVACLDVIPPKNIVRIFDENWVEVRHDVALGGPTNTGALGRMEALRAAHSDAKALFPTDVRSQNRLVYEVGIRLGMGRDEVSQIINPKPVAREASMER